MLSMVSHMSVMLSGAWRPYPMHSMWLIDLKRAKEYSSLQESFWNSKRGSTEWLQCMDVLNMPANSIRRGLQGLLKQGSECRQHTICCLRHVSVLGLKRKTLEQKTKRGGGKEGGWLEKLVHYFPLLPSSVPVPSSFSDLGEQTWMQEGIQPRSASLWQLTSS